MKKQYNYQKTSFIFIETIVSLLILSIIVSGFYKLSYSKDNSHIFTQLNKITNNLKSKNNFPKTNIELEVILDDLHKTIQAKQITIETDNFKLIKYEQK